MAGRQLQRLTKEDLAEAVHSSEEEETQQTPQRLAFNPFDILTDDEQASGIAVTPAEGAMPH